MAAEPDDLKDQTVSRSDSAVSGASEGAGTTTHGIGNFGAGPFGAGPFSSAEGSAGRVAKWQAELQNSGHPLSEALGHLVPINAVLTAKPPLGVSYLFSRSTLGFLREAASYAIELPTPFEDGYRRVIDLDAAMLELKTRIHAGSSGDYAFNGVLTRSNFGNGWGTGETVRRAKDRDLDATALGPSVVEALALAAWIAQEESGEIAPVRLDDFVFGVMGLAGADAGSLGRALGVSPTVAQASALRNEVGSLLPELSSAVGRPRAKQYAELAPDSWTPLPTAAETPDYQPDRPIEEPGRDLLGFNDDARAIAELICLDEAGARAVGVFGDWGSGKSSLLNLVRHQIEDLLSQKRQVGATGSAEADPFIGHVEHVRFNVWQYNDSDLMLSLADVSLKQLGRFKAIEELQMRLRADRATWVEEKALGEEALALAEAQHQTAIDRIEKADEDAKAARNNASEAARREVAGLLRQGGAGPSTADDLLRLADNGKMLFSTLSLTNVRYLRAANARYWLLAIFLGCLGAYVAWKAADGSRGFAVLVGVLGFVAPIAKFVASLNEALIGYARSVDSVERTREAAVADGRRQSDRALKAIAVETRKVEQTVAKIEAYADDGGPQLWRYLLHDSPQAQQIKQARGVTNQAQDLFESINGVIGDGPRDGAAHKRAELPDRVVFYIDELDRCRAPQVVRMLEAIHLLLAFDNFAVIVAVDSRWLVSSLKSVFRDELASSERPSGGNRSEITAREYIEKIIQLPVHVRPLAFAVAEDGNPSGTFVGLVDDLTATAAGLVGPREEEEENGSNAREEGSRITHLSTAPERVLPRETLQAAAERARLTADEITGLHRMGGLVSASPRTVKRFVNLYRLVRALQTDAALKQFRDRDFAPVQMCLAIQCGMDATRVARFRKWLSAADDGVPQLRDVLMEKLGLTEAAADAAVAGEALTSPAARSELQRAWASTERFAFWG